MAHLSCRQCIEALSCEMFGLVLVVAVCIVWILGWTGNLPVLSDEIKNIQSYSSIVNAVFGIVNVIVLIFLGWRTKKKLAKLRVKDSERLCLLHDQAAMNYAAIQNVTDVTEGVQQRLDNIIDQNKELLTDTKQMLAILDSQSSPLCVVEDNFNRSMSQTLMIKIILIGDPMTGKTCLAQRWVTDKFFSHYKGTIGVDFALKTLHTNTGDIKIQLWDIGGQERFGSMGKVYYKDTVCCVVMFDASRPHTFDGALKWYKDFQEKSSCNQAFVAFLGNKIDLYPWESDTFNKEIIFEALNGAPCFFSSAKTGENVRHAMSLISLGAVVNHSKSSYKQ